LVGCGYLARKFRHATPVMVLAAAISDAAVKRLAQDCNADLLSQAPATDFR